MLRCVLLIGLEIHELERYAEDVVKYFDMLSENIGSTYNIKGALLRVFRMHRLESDHDYAGDLLCHHKSGEAELSHNILLALYI